MVALLLLLATACQPLLESHSERPWGPPSWYAGLFQEVQGCLGSERPYGAIQWFLAEEITLDGDARHGYWDRPDRIVLLEGWEDDASLVAHEMIHYALQDGHSASFDGSHPADALFLECGASPWTPM